MYLKRLILVLLALIMTACGGGSSGTGDPGIVKLQALLLNQDNIALKDIKVRSLNNGQEALSNSSGLLEINLQPDAGKASLVFLLNGKEIFFELQNIVATDTALEAVFKLDSNNFTVSIESYQIEDIPQQPTTNPSATPTPSEKEQDKDSDTEQQQVSIFKGSIRVVNFNNTALSGVRVEIDRTGKSDTTDSEGRFEIRSRVISGNIKLNLHFANGVSKQVVISAVPDRAVVVSLRIRINLNLPDSDKSNLSNDYSGQDLQDLFTSSNVSASLGDAEIR